MYKFKNTYPNILGCSLILFLLAAHWTTSTAQMVPGTGGGKTGVMTENKFLQTGLYAVWLLGAVGVTFVFIPMGTLWIFIFETLLGSLATSEIGGSGGILSAIWSVYYFDTIPWDLNFFTG